jgi:adenylate cyclase class IV
MHNVEFKAELRDPALARTLCRQIKAAWVVTMKQVDTYFRLADGRLKKREIWIDTGPGPAPSPEGDPRWEPHPPEWIFYHRADQAKARLSAFAIYSQAQAEARFGTVPLPVWVTVRKVREVWMHTGVRIHLDHVEDLGHYLEMEALISQRQPLAACYQQIALLRQALGPVMGEVLSGSYSDLLASDPKLTIPATPPAPPR